MMAKGRKPYEMTPRRNQVLTELRKMGEPRWKELARRCSIRNFRNARRIALDLKKMGLVNF